MIYLIIAHYAEAEPIIQKYKLKRIHLFAYTVFTNDDIKLILCKMGIDNALMATSVLLGHFLPTKHDLLINIGLCGANKITVGQALLIHKITYKNHSYFPDILFEHSLIETDLITSDTAVESILNSPVDMEAYGIYKAASKFLKAHQMLFLKIVSDNFEPQTITKELAKQLITKNLEKLENIIALAKHTFKKDIIFSVKEKKLIQDISAYLTKAQTDTFLDACYYYKFHRNNSLHVSNIKIPITRLTKQQRSSYVKQLIQTLTS